MDPLSVGLFIAMMVAIVFLFFDVRFLKKEVGALNRVVPEVAASMADRVSDARVSALEIENRTIKAELAEIKARQKIAPALQRPGSFRAFQNQTRGWEIEQ